MMNHHIRKIKNKKRKKIINKLKFRVLYNLKNNKYIEKIKKKIKMNIKKLWCYKK